MEHSIMHMLSASSAISIYLSSKSNALKPHPWKSAKNTSLPSLWLRSSIQDPLREEAPSIDHYIYNLVLIQ